MNKRSEIMKSEHINQHNDWAMAPPCLDPLCIEFDNVVSPPVRLKTTYRIKLNPLPGRSAGCDQDSFANAPLGPPREKPNITAVFINKGRDIEPAASLNIGFNRFNCSTVSVLDSSNPILF